MAKVNEQRGARVREQLTDMNPEAVVFDGLDGALIGIGNQYTGDPLAIYSESAILDLLKLQIDSDLEDAIDYFDFNVACLWAGPGTPIIMYDSALEV